MSTRDPLFAWALVIGEGFSGALLRRATRARASLQGHRPQGGGIAECSYWRARAPLAVLRDLHVTGGIDDSGTAGNCGKTN